jgi:hypothetical protein
MKLYSPGGYECWELSTKHIYTSWIYFKHCLWPMEYKKKFSAIPHLCSRYLLEASELLQGLQLNATFVRFFILQCSNLFSVLH